VLKEWGWNQRPTAVVSIGSHRRPGLVNDTAGRIASIGRLPYLGAIAPADPHRREAPRGNSAQRLLQVHDAFRLPEDLAAAVKQNQGPILLVDDRVDTGWTMTVATRLLRQAGADAVLPFALALEA
jgi:ATP-dependent DNA helicase RecQ